MLYYCFVLFWVDIYFQKKKFDKKKNKGKYVRTCKTEIDMNKWWWWFELHFSICSIIFSLSKTQGKKIGELKHDDIIHKIEKMEWNSVYIAGTRAQTNIL